MYSPKIDEKLIPKLYRLKLKTKKPMTHMVNEALIEYLQKRKEFITNDQDKHARLIKNSDQSFGKNYQDS